MSIATEITSSEEGRVELAVAVSEDAVEQAFEQALQRLARGVKVPGFRQGKVPTSVVMSRFGRPVVVQEMLKVSLAEWYEQAVVESGIRPIDDPDLALDDVPEKGELRFRAVVPTRPKAKLGAVTGLEVAKDEPEIPEGALEAELERLRMRGSRMAPVDRPAAEGDFLVVDFDGVVNGKRLASASARDYVVELGSERLLAGFDEKLRGSRAGDAVTIEVTDDGTGPLVPVGPGLAASAADGRGLAGMRERAALFGGELRAGPEPGGGFTVRARLPVATGSP